MDMRRIPGGEDIANTILRHNAVADAEDRRPAQIMEHGPGGTQAIDTRLKVG
jgi:hypothetical protein